MPNLQTSGPGYLCSSGTFLQHVQYGWSYQQLGCCQHSFRVTHARKLPHPAKFAFNKIEIPAGKPITTWHTILSYRQDGCLCIPVSVFHIFTVCQSTSYIFLAYMVLPTILSKFTTQKQNILGATAGTTSPMLKIRFLPTFCAQITSIKKNIWPTL
jgi:hypothetical protein